MNILVLIKYSLDIAEIKVDPKTCDLRLEGVPEKFGNIDKNAVEAAVRLKEKTGGTVKALTLGPARARDGFKDILAMGADEAILVEDPAQGNADAVVCVRVLEAAIRKLGVFDLIVCGFASDDGYTYQVAPRLAERLGLPLVSYARSLEARDGKISAERDLESNLQQVEAPLPCIVSIAEEAFPPRRTTLMDAIKAKKKPVTVWTAQDTPEIEQVLSENQTFSRCVGQKGIVVQRKQQILKGQSMAEIADQLIDSLIHENILKEGE
ncbi:MAG: electron transfer flavoprotein subunit beta/FixA family protein [Chloroflexi bacterium]|nr:electron transfer flavoprotein subunit beta/FixA family protein [Chloroflexota bacterium]